MEEVSRLRDMGYGPDLASMSGLGYAEVGEYLSGRWSLENAKETIKKNTRRYAKRQMTWFRSERGVLWYEPQEEDKIYRVAMKFYEEYYDHPAA